MSSAICFNSDQSKMLSSGNGLSKRKKKPVMVWKSKLTDGWTKQDYMPRNVFLTTLSV